MRLIGRIAGTAAVTAVVAVLVVIYLRSEGAGAIATAPRRSASSRTGAEQSPKSTASSAGPGACGPPRICGSQTGSSQGSSRKATYTGPVVENAYGPVQVAVAEEGSKIVDVKALQLPTEHARSQEISEQVAPMLRTEVLQAQNAEISVVSGATYTSESYASSLQGALRQAG